VILPALSILAIAAAIAVGTLRRVNVGFISIALAFALGHFAVGLPGSQIVSGWPLSLFVMLLGMTLLFGIARVNGTLSAIAERMVAATLGHTRLIPPAFFLLAGGLAAMGAGNIVVCAIVLPIALTVAVDRGISPLLMSTLVIAGSNAGGLSPLAPTGIIANSLSRELGFDIAGAIFVKQIIGQTLLATLLYLLLKGHRLPSKAAEPRPDGKAHARLSAAQWGTLAVLMGVVAGVVGFRLDIGLTAFSGAALLLFFRVADEAEVVRSVPWGTLLLVSGVTVLVKVSEQAGGIALLSEQLNRFLDAGSAAPVMALIGGTLSLVSSASGVVLPTLIPTVPGLVQETGGDPARLISAIVMGAHMVTNSPISTLGALAVASAGFGIDRQKLFNQLLGVGLCGILFAALIVYLGIV
jgi:Na+/H+ antiporter NhaD/arsenite permease-like protein